MSVVDNIRFAKAFLSNPGAVGAVAPSSSALAAAMTQGLKFRHGHSILEFGPGTGAFTGAISEFVGNQNNYLGIEMDAAFVQLLEQRFPGLQFICGLAQDAEQLHAESGVGPVGAILSGLPFASLSRDAQDQVMDCLVRLMKPGTEFRTFQYAHAYLLPNAVRFRRRMNQLFGPVERSRAVIRNLPPAYVLRWQR